MSSLKTSKYWWVPVQEEHIRYLAGHIAQEDKREVLTGGFSTVEESIRYSVGESPDALAFGVADRVLCIHGVSPYSKGFFGRTGCIWMLAAEELPTHYLAFLRASKKWVAEQREQYDMLSNIVPDWYARTLRWLFWLGFERKRIDMFADGRYWYHMQIRGSKWAQQQQ